MAPPIRILTAVPICDGHDSAINTINLEFIRHGIEVVYLGYHRSVGDIVRAAIQEDVRAIGISSYNGGHIEFFTEVVALLRKKGAADSKVFGGAGKTPLMDELVMRFYHKDRQSLVAILSLDPSVIGEGALLGDRATMINSQNDRVFMRSMATRGQAGGLSPATHDCLALLARSDFDYVIIETVGTGQEAMPFQKDGLIDLTVLVMNPDYGSRLQLQKIVMLDLADVVVVNKSDLQRARTAHTEIEQRLEQNRPARRSLGAGGQSQQLVDTVAKRHRDPGVDKLFELICNRG